MRERAAKTRKENRVGSSDDMEAGPSHEPARQAAGPRRRENRVGSSDDMEAGPSHQPARQAAGPSRGRASVKVSGMYY